MFVTPVLATMPAQAAPQSAKPDPAPTKAEAGAERSHNRFDPLATQKASTKQRALDELAAGDARLVGKGTKRKIELADGSLVSYPINQTAQLLTFLVEFGDDETGSPFPGQTGPLHNEIPEPARSDNTSYWKSDFSREHYLDMFFNGMPEQDGESFKDSYKEMSSGRFDLEGDVSDWVKLDKAAGTYSQADGEESQEDMTDFIQDSANAWYDDQIAQGKTPEQIVEYLDGFDVWDRFDLDGDGITDEPDGYIDHFQAIHAGSGEEAGAEPWAIWSHRWSANQGGFNQDGPETTEDCTACYPAGGIQIGDTGMWIRDYTTEPEDGGLGVFAHEFAHDLGLPDFYDTKKGDNGTGFWTLMSSGSWLSHGDGATGTTPNHMGPTEKRFLGWYGANDLATVDVAAGESGKVTLGPSYHASTVGAQAALVNVPDGYTDAEAPEELGEGTFLYSGERDRTSATAVSKPIAITAATADLTAKVNYDIEEDWDYAYLQVSDDDGATWTSVATSESRTTNPNGSNLGQGISGATDGWIDLTADLSAYADKTVRLRWNYVTDDNTHGFGMAVDDLAVGDYTSNFDSANDWTLGGWFAAAEGTYQANYSQYYLVENRQYMGYDATLAEGPYIGTNVRTNTSRVAYYPYQDGMLVWFQNGLYGDNNTILHPGGGQSLPVDAHPKMIKWSDGSRPNSRLQSYDATFDVDTTDGVSFTAEAEPDGTRTLSVPSSPGVTTFDDTDPDAYWDAENPWGSTKVAGSGTIIKVLSSNETTGQMVIEIGSKAPKATKAPVVSGKAQVGKTLKASTGTWDQSDLTYSYQWYASGQLINGATAATYQLQPQDVGKKITVMVTAKSATSIEGVAESAPTAKVAKAPTKVKVTAPKPIKKGKKAKVTIEVTSAFTPTGMVKVKYAGKLVGVKALKNGKVTVTVPAKKKAGKYALVVKYQGADAFARSSKTVKLTVK